jgi:Raf kinase inhibitor-like YbhB/YbcL family protein
MWAAGPLRARRVAALTAAAIAAAVAHPAHTEEASVTTFELTSPGFAAHGEIPRKHTCEGADVSPALQWSGVPDGAKSLVLIVDDPDAPDPAHPKMTWVHWVLYDIPPESSGLPEGVAPAALPSGTKQGRNDWKRTGYGGPCPPVGRHRYFHKLYALNAPLGDLDEPDKAALERAMEGVVIGRAELVGTYEKQR